MQGAKKLETHRRKAEGRPIRATVGEELSPSLPAGLWLMGRSAV